MEDLLLCYPVQDESESDVIYGCLIMNRDVEFDPTKFQTRLDEEFAR